MSTYTVSPNGPNLTISEFAHWERELRFGNHNQGTGALHQVFPNGKEFLCCLGVLCKTTWRRLNIDSDSHLRSQPDPVDGSYKVSYNGIIGVLPADLFEKEDVYFDIAYSDCGVENTDVFSFSGLNDNCRVGYKKHCPGLTFDQIADLIHFLFVGSE